MGRVRLRNKYSFSASSVSVFIDLWLGCHKSVTLPGNSPDPSGADVPRDEGTLYFWLSHVRGLGAVAEVCVRRLLACLLILCAAGVAEARAPNFSSSDAVLHWMYDYRSAPAPLRLPEAVHAMRRHGLLADSKKNGFFVGFIAGVLSRNPKSTPKLVKRMLPMPAKEQAVIIRAVAYSGLPNWRDVLSHFRKKMPYRAALIDSYLAGDEPTLMYVPIDHGPEIVYALWGYYYATGHFQPVVRVISALKWAPAESKSGFSFRRLFTGPGEPTYDELIIGATAKWTLAAHAERHRHLLDLYKAEIASRDDEAVVEPLKEIVAASENFRSEDIREEQLVTVDKAKAKKARDELRPSSKVTLSSIAIATGCVVATATGHPEIAVPCVVSGAIFSGVTRYFQSKK